MSWSNRDRDCKNGYILFKRRFRGRHHRGILNSLLFYLFCLYFLFLYNLILLFLIGNTCTEMVILNKLEYTRVYFIDLCEIVQFVKAYIF